MAGIYIKNMEMPEKCEDCRFWDGQNNGCPIVHMITLRRTHQKKPDWCPLVEVPDHGDLIDRDVVVARLADWSKRLIETYGENDEYVNCLSDVLEGLGCDEVVIPAERSEDE